MLPFARAGRVVAGSFRKLLEGWRPSVRECEKKIMSTGSDSSDDPKRCEMYDIRKYGHQLPKFDTPLCFDALPSIPTGVFRNVAGESRIGPGACKCYPYYQNPEYFCFHHMTYYDLHLILRCYRQPAPKTGRKA